MEDDGRPLLSSEQTGENYSHRGSTDSLDFKAKRPFHVEPRNIVDDDLQERVSAEAAILNSRVHYYSRLTGSSDRLLSPPNHVIPGPEEIYIYSPLGTAFKVTGSDHASKNPSIITIFAIWNTMMGTSILSIPWGIKQAGFTLGILILVFTGLLMLYCCYIVLKSPKSILPPRTTQIQRPRGGRNHHPRGSQDRPKGQGYEVPPIPVHPIPNNRLSPKTKLLQYHHRGRHARPATPVPQHLKGHIIRGACQRCKGTQQTTNPQNPITLI